MGYNVDLGYYAQNQEDVLDKKMTVYDTLDYVAVGDIRAKLRDILGAFLFKGEDVDKKVAVLSGGERSRLAMAKLILHPYNLLLLDEPTNHMDIRSKDVLKQALQRYDGTLVVVSHDRDFLDGLVDKVYEFKDGRVKEYLGGVQDFLEARKIENLQELERKEVAAAPKTRAVPEKPSREAAGETPAGQQGSGSQVAGSKGSGPQGGGPNAAGSKADYQQQREVKKKARQLEICEKKIAELEAEIARCEKLLAEPQAGTDIDTVLREYLEFKRSLDRQMEQWMTLSEN